MEHISLVHEQLVSEVSEQIAKERTAVNKSIDDIRHICDRCIGLLEMQDKMNGMFFSNHSKTNLSVEFHNYAIGGLYFLTAAHITFTVLSRCLGW